MKYPNIYLRNQTFTHVINTKEQFRGSKQFKYKIVFGRFNMLNVLDYPLFATPIYSFNPYYGPNYFPLGSVVALALEPI